MAIIILGCSKCVVCNEPIEEQDELVGFPAFVLNDADPLYRFSDAVCHQACFRADPQCASMIAALTERDEKSGPGQRACAMCGQEVIDRNDYLGIGYLGEPDAAPLGKFNYTHLHTFCVSKWARASEFLMLAKAAIAERRWRGPALEQIVREVEARIESDGHLGR